MARDLISVFSKPEDIVLDPTAGSGSTLIAAKILGRRWLGVEISEEYCALARRRVEEMHTNLVPGRAEPRIAPDNQGALFIGDW